MQLQASRFEALGAGFFARLGPEPLPDPYWVAASPAAAQALGLTAQWPHDGDAAEQHAALAWASGNALPAGAVPLASVYSGHQFGVWAGQLGDGRALLLGERASASGLWEVQLKGSGRTPYSRTGDGRAVLRSSVREFLASEAMHALGVPSTRALCITGSRLPVQREDIETAAVVTRLAPSFMRFGHFEHFAQLGQRRGDFSALQALADFALAHHYPDCAVGAPNPYLALFETVSQRSALLVAQWQALGFCHGVLNTDNMSLLGLTLDYGPFQFMDHYDPEHICNHSDHAGRYAFARQPAIVHWNLAALGQALLPLIDARDAALAVLRRFPAQFEAALQVQLNDKLGLSTVQAGDADLSAALLQTLAAERCDWTLFWRRLSECAAELLDAPRAGLPLPVRALLQRADALDRWVQRWAERLRADPDPDPARLRARMLRTNPRLVLRNYLAHNAIVALQQGGREPLQRLQAELAQPYDASPWGDELAALPPDWAADLSLSCSS